MSVRTEHSALLVHLNRIGVVENDEWNGFEEVKEVKEVSIRYRLTIGSL